VLDIDMMNILENAAIITGLSFFLSFFLCFSVWSSVYPLIAGIEVSRLYDHTPTHHTRYDSSRHMISPSQRSLRDDTQHSQRKEIHAPDGIRTCNTSQRAAVDPLLKPCSRWDQCSYYIRDTGPYI